ncbi:MAG: hypothetical protein ABIR24_10430 [Verrucomicrobiota bacterium]
MKSQLQLAIFALGLIFFTSGCETAQKSPRTDASSKNFDELILTQFVSAPFPHSARAEGHNYKTNFFPSEKHYRDNTVAIFIPKNFQPSAKIDFVVHCHGWRNTVTNVLRQYELPQQLVESGKNAILIVPQGPRNAPDSFGGKLEDENGFRNFMDEVLATLRQQKPFRKSEIGTIILSGHSGGYQVISSILEKGGLTKNVKEVWLFDGLYARTDKFQNWFENSGGRFIDIYTANGGTKTETENLMHDVKKKGANYFSTEEKDVRMQSLRDNRLIFIFTELPHDDVLHKHKTFLQFLQTSCLSNAEKK